MAAGAEPAGAEPAGAEQRARSSNRGARPAVRFEAGPAPWTSCVDLSWLELLPPRRLKPLCDQKGLSVGWDSSEALAKRLRASGGLSLAQLKELCDAPEVGVQSYGSKAEIAQRIGAKLSAAAAATTTTARIGGGPLVGHRLSCRGECAEMGRNI